MDSDAFYPALFGAAVGALIPIVTELLFRPPQARRQRRVELYLRLVPAAIRGAQDQPNDSREAARLAEALMPVEALALLAGREDRRVMQAVIDAKTAFERWFPAGVDIDGLDNWTIHEDVDGYWDAWHILPEYIANELTGYHVWLRHSIRREPLLRYRAKHSHRRKEPWATIAQKYIDEAPAVIDPLWHRNRADPEASR